MSSLYGRSPKNSLRELLKIQEPSLGSSLSTIETGDAVATPLQLSPTQVAINGLVWPTTGAAQGKVLTVASGGTTLTWETPSTASEVTWANISGKPAVIAAGATAADAKTVLSLQNVDNTSDAGKPVSIAQQSALNAKANTTAVPYDIGMSMTGKPGVSEAIIRVVVPRAFSLTGAVGRSGVTGSGAATDFVVAKNGTSIGYVRFNNSVATLVSVITTTSFASGDILTVVAPATQNSTLADLDITLIGNLV